MAVDCGGHFLPGKKCHDLFLGWNKLSRLCLLQRLPDKMGKHFNFCPRKQLLNPEENTEVQKQTFRPELKLFIA